MDSVEAIVIVEIGIGWDEMAGGGAEVSSICRLSRVGDEDMRGLRL